MALAQVTYYSAGSHSVPRSGAPQPNWYYGMSTTNPPGSALGYEAFGDGQDIIRTWPTMTVPYTAYWGYAASNYYPSSTGWTPIMCFTSVVVGSGQTPRVGVYNPDNGTFEDQTTGTPFDPQTGEDLPGTYEDGFEVENPFSDRPFSFDLVMTDPATGQVLSEGTYTLGPGATMPFALKADQPFDWAIYPRADGVRSTTPTQSGGGSYGGSTTSGGPPLMHNDSPYTSPNSPQPTAPSGDVQAEVKRLADLMQQTENAQRTSANLQFDELTKLNATATGAKQELSDIRETIEAGNGILSSIEANTAATADNTQGGASGGMTQAQFEESMDGDGLTVHPMTVGSDSDGVALVTSVLALKDSLESLADAITISAPAGSTSLSFSMPTPAGTVVIDLESYSSWFGVARAVLLFLAVIWFFNEITQTLRSAVS